MLHDDSPKSFANSAIGGQTGVVTPIIRCMRTMSSASWLVALVVGLTAVTGPASAGSSQISDPVGDVKVTGASENGPTPDIVTFRTVYRPKRIKLVTTFDASPFPAYMELVAPVVTPHDRYTVYWFSSGSMREPLLVTNRVCRGSLASMSGLRHVTLSIPARCLGRPRWVRTGIEAYTSYAAGEGSSAIDVAGTRKTGRTPLGPRVRPLG